MQTARHFSQYPINDKFFGLSDEHAEVRKSHRQSGVTLIDFYLISFVASLSISVVFCF